MNRSVLVVEDDASTRMILRRMLEARGLRVTECGSAEEGLELLTRTFAAIIVLDLNLPGMDGLEFCRRLRQQPEGDRHYILIATAHQRIEDLEGILAAGADDYMTKPFDARMLNIRMTVAEKQAAVLTRRKALEEELRFLAVHDPLTGLANRGTLDETLERLIAGTRAGRSGALLYLDLDNFKVINDTLGHPAGDRLLVEMAGLLRGQTRAGDGLVRFGGDEFVAVLEDVDTTTALGVAGRLRDALGAFCLREGGREFRATGSIGVAMAEPGLTPAGLLARADSACYAAKARGRNQAALFEPGDSELGRLAADTQRVTEIRRAIESGTLELWFQPVVRLDGSGTVFHEVLLRDRGPAGELVPPGLFLPAVERAGLAFDLDLHVINRTFTLLAEHPGLTLSVNISGKTLDDPRFAEEVRRLCTSSGVEPGRVIFEITETALVGNLARARARIEAMIREGHRFALDDFGSGMSSLRYLQELPVSILKIDGAFIERWHEDAVGRAIVKSVAEVAALLGLETVAEFVQDGAAMESLRKIGITCGQGAHFGMAVPELPA